MSTRDTLFKAAGIIAAASVLSKFLGFVREVSLAAVFGATNATDAYLMGQTIPMVVFAAVSAALGTTFIPVFSQVRHQEGRRAAFRFASSVFNVTLFLSCVAILVGELLAGSLVRLVAPGFYGPVYNLTVELTRIMFPSVLFQAILGLISGMLQTDGNFSTPALVSLAFNVVLIPTILGLGPIFGIRVVAVGTVAAIGMQVVLQIPALFRSGFRWQPGMDLLDPGLVQMRSLVGPILIATTVGQAGSLVDRMLASGLQSGSVAALNYANRLTGLVPGVLGAAINTVMYPTLAQLAAENDWRRFSKAFAEAVKMINFVLIPVAVGMAVLRVPLIQLVFQRGAFDVQATQATAWALLFYSPVVAASSLCDMTSRAFFAFQDSRTPMVINTLGIGINIGLNLLLIGPLRHGGLALATSLATVFGACTLLWMLRVRLRMLSRSSANSLSNTDSHLPAEIGKGQHPRNDYSFANGPVGIGGKSILSSLWRVVLASALMGGVAWWSYVRLSFYVPGSNVALQAVRLLGAISAGTLSYGVAVWALGVPELQVAFDGAQQVWYKARSKIHDLRVGRKEDAAALKR